MRAQPVRSLSMLTLLLAACGSDDPEGVCDPVAQSGCEEGLVCEVVTGAEPGCFAPVVARGEVFDLVDEAAVTGARIVALDLNGTPVSSVALSRQDGSYELAIPSTRDADGVPTIPTITLRADAAGYQTFPGGLRRALPVDVSAPVAEEDGTLVVESSLTSIGLIGILEEAPGSISGRIELPPDTVGVLVVAEDDVGNGHSAIADRTGDYAIFNLPAATYTVKAYARGSNYVPGTATVGSEEVEVNLALSGEPASSLSGKVEIVDPGAGTATSVILVVESTYDEGLRRGESPPGLRAPDPGMAPNVTGDFTIRGVPAGRYVVLAAFENDDLVRDPDSCIAGTEVVHQEVGPGEEVVVEQSFKVTGALEVIEPGAIIAQEVSVTPVFQWVDDASEDEYRVVVIDSFGDPMWSTTLAGTVGQNPSLEYGGEPLQSGMYYQFRVTSVRTAQLRDCEISETEELEGVFVYR